MKLTYILLIALVALALHLAWTGILAPALAGGNGGISGGDVHARVLEPLLAGGNGGVNGGEVHSLAGRKPGASGGSEI